MNWNIMQGIIDWAVYNSLIDESQVLELQASEAIVSLRWAFISVESIILQV